MLEGKPKMQSTISQGRPRRVRHAPPVISPLCWRIHRRCAGGGKPRPTRRAPVPWAAVRGAAFRRRGRGFPPPRPSSSPPRHGSPSASMQLLVEDRANGEGGRREMGRARRGGIRGACRSAGGVVGVALPREGGGVGGRPIAREEAASGEAASLGEAASGQVQRIDEVVDLHREDQNTSSPRAFKMERESSRRFPRIRLLPRCPRMSTAPGTVVLRAVAQRRRRDPVRARESFSKPS